MKLMSGLQGTNIDIFTYSLADLQALEGGRIMTTLVDDCRLAVQGLIEAGNIIRLL